MGEIIRKLEYIIEQFDKVLFFSGSTETIFNLTKTFCQSSVVKFTDKKVLVLFTKQIPCDNDNIVFAQISKEEAKQLANLYFMYEFSNKFILVSERKSYATLFSFVDTGIISIEEAFQALLI